MYSDLMSAGRCKHTPAVTFKVRFASAHWRCPEPRILDAESGLTRP
jgi:hypothetical protein